MSPRTFVSRGAALLALAAFGMAACESKTVVQPNPFPLQVVVSPSSLSFTAAGQKAQLSASVTGGDAGQAAQGVNWASGNTAVATVDANGNVTAVANGTTTVIATSKAVGTVSGAAAVTVAIPVQPPVNPPAAPTVSIQSITTNGGANVDINNTTGQINVALNVDVPTGNTISSVNVQVDGTTVCSQTFTQGAQGDVTVAAANAVVIVCPINTASLKADGTPTFANGPHTVTATLVGPGGTVKASTSQSLVFANVNDLQVTTTPSKGPATGPGGFAWVGGSLTVTVKPVIFSGAPIARVVVTLDNGAVQVDSTAADGFSVTFSDTLTALQNGVKDLEAATNINIATVTNAGQNGPSYNWNTAGRPTLRIDNVAPQQVQFFFNDADGWVNGAFAFSSALDTTKTPAGAARAGNVDLGVDRVTYTFSGGASRSALTTATTAGDLAETATADSFAVKVVIADALGNSTTVWGSVRVLNDTTKAGGGHFGIDKQAPVVVFDAANTVADTAKFKTNPTTANYVIGFQDLGASGFATATPLQIIEKADTGGGSVCVMGSGTGCTTPAASNSAVPVDGAAGTQQGYITMTAFVEDRAGNKSNTLTRRVLVDYTNPVVDSAVITTAPLAGGASETFRAFLHDTVSLASAAGNVQYTAALPAGVNFIKTLGTVSFGGFGTFTKAATADFTDPFFFRAVALATGAPLASPGLGGYVLPSALNIAPVDVATNAPAATAISAFTGLAAPTTDPWAGATFTAAADSSSALLNATVTITGTAATVSPAAQVLFYQYATSGSTAGQLQLVGTSTSGVITVNGTQATFTFTPAPTATLKPGTRALVAVFVTSGGVAMAVPATFSP